MTARFITEDTYTGQKNDPLSLNLYTYCANNPIIYVDPSGHRTKDLKKGSSGEDVKVIQEMLILEGYDLGKSGADGKFGAKTKAAVIQYQKDNNLKADGIVGTKTLTSLQVDYWTDAAEMLVDANKSNEVATKAYNKAMKDYEKAINVASQTINFVNSSTENFSRELTKNMNSSFKQAVEEKSKDLKEWAFHTCVQNLADGFAISFGAKYMLPYETTAVKGASKTISYTDYDNIYQSSIHNAGKNKVMLGKYDGGGSTSYINKAGKDYEYFSLGDDWNKIKKQYGYTDDDMFKLFNESFLDDGINAGKSFTFSHNPVGDTGALGQEYAYLKRNGYVYNSSSMTMVPKKK